MYYSVCWCTLAGTKACENCNNNPNRETSGWITTDGSTYKTNWYTYPVYDSDRYELVEKKDWRINYLKQQLEDKKKESASLNAAITSLTDRIMEVSGEIKKMEDELKELEL